MPRIFLMLLMILIITGVAVLGIRFLYQIMINLQPSSQKILADVRQMKTNLKLFMDDLVPWNSEEMDLLSLNQVHKKLTKGIAPTARGVITSIYHEPMIAWSYKRYFGKEENSVLYATTTHHEFLYRVKKGEVTVHIDNQLVGPLKEDGLLYSAKTGRLIARINRPNRELLMPIVIGDREVASLVDPARRSETNPRALEFLSAMNNEEEAVFLSLAIFEIIKSELPKE